MITSKSFSVLFVYVVKMWSYNCTEDSTQYLKGKKCTKQKYKKNTRNMIEFGFLNAELILITMTTQSGS